MKIMPIIATCMVAIMSAQPSAAAGAAGAAGAADVARTIVRKGAVQIEVLEQGAGRAIVILPSLGRSAEDYDSVARYLAADGYRVIRPEPRGIKASKGPMTGLTLHDFAADVAMVMDDRKTGPAIIVGHAWGSQPARMLAVDRPDLVRGIVMAAASVGKVPPGSTEKPYGRLREAIDGSGNMALPREQRLTYLRQAFFAPGNDPRPWLTGWYHATHDAQAHARIITPIDSYYSGGKTVPILDLQGEHDAVVVKNVLQALIPDRVETRVIAGSGHAMAPEKPREMAEAIAAFAKRVYARAR
ncbi:alpha/beta fold hydrolase [Sphingomonas montana]|uniref:alpha/beta fold hydrolase n=1 Tax=Sphingomonas montana TaxID=1843236 RepID=UPI0009F91948|nr:alpha/beta fold hydrolase [Sphingomonas montana]